jgi:hypothetical protein
MPIIISGKINILIVVTQLGKGDPDIYVNRDKILPPVKGISDYKSEHY